MFFPDILKTFEIIPCFKKGDQCQKENNRLVSILPNFSKGFERLTHNQLNELLETKNSTFFTDFQKNHNTQYIMVS